MDTSETVRDEYTDQSVTDRDELLASKDRIISILENQLSEEREARRRADTIIAQVTQANATLAARVPELEAAQEPSEHAEEPAERGVGYTSQLVERNLAAPRSRGGGRCS